jgi:diguanylate cyclase (GGDEF)-like protein
MNIWTMRTVKFIFLPGGAILLGAFLLLDTRWISPSPSAVSFFYYSVFIAAALLAWRFHYTRILFSVAVLLLAHRALEFFAQGRLVTAGPGRIAFEALALLLPLNFVFLTFFPERGSEGRTLFWFLALLFFESVFVAAICRPDQPVPGFLHFSLVSAHPFLIPQPALLILGAALCLLLVRMLQHHKATESGMFWSLAAVWLGFQSGGVGKIGSAYFATAALALASSIIENSYLLAYQDELTRLPSRRAFNDALLRLKAPYAVATVDIDHFKSVNDTYGHDTGDHVLRLVGSRLARVSGGGEAFRVGGEEFTVLFANRSAKEVVDYLELLRLNIENSAFRLRSGEERRKLSRSPDRRASSTKRSAPRHVAAAAKSLSVTVSIGLAESQPQLKIEEVIQQADKALYRAKHGGRNRIETALAQRKNPRAGKLRGSAQS